MGLTSGNVRFGTFIISTFTHLDPDALDLDAPPNHPSTVYDLIANVTHESTAGTTRDKENTVYKVHLRAGGTDDDWYQIQDLIVEKTRKEMIFLGEAVLQVGRVAFTCCFSLSLTSP